MPMLKKDHYLKRSAVFVIKAEDQSSININGKTLSLYFLNYRYIILVSYKVDHKLNFMYSNGETIY